MEWNHLVKWESVNLNRILFFIVILAAGVAGIAKGSERVLLLSGHDWWIHDDPNGTGESSGFDSAGIAGAGWVPAKVPGNIQADVEAAHLLPPMWYGATNPQLYDVAGKDWWYRKDFVAPASFAKQRLTLVFDGVDERCQVWLNGKKIGVNAGMFRRFEIDVSNDILPGQKNRIAVWIAGMPEELAPLIVNSDGPGEKDPFGPYGFMTGVNKTRALLKDLKTPGNFSYDWGFNIWTLGIWKDVRIEASGPARIQWTQVETKLAEDQTSAAVRVALEVQGVTDLPMKAIFRVSGHEASFTKTIETVVKKGQNTVLADIQMDHPLLWWPYGQGDQPLYRLDAELVSADGCVSDSRAVRFGVRDIKWIHTEGAPTDYINRYQLVINGRMVRTIGSGLILPGVLPVRMFEHNLQLLHQAKACGMNTLRLNGGGGPPLFDTAWYDLADELGIMIQYEFPIGNSTQGRPETDEVFLENLEATCRSLIKESRNHPSIIEYGGGNEMEWDEKSKHPALQVMRKVVSEETDRLFRATSPDLGGKHAPWDFDILGSNTGYGGSYSHYNGFLQSTKDPQTETMSYSEMGSCSPSHLEVWHRDAPIASQWPINTVDDPVLIRKNATRAVFSPEHWLVKNRIDTVFGSPDNLQDFIAAGQYLGADGLRYIYDELRRKGKKVANITNHCYSEPCPNLAGSYLVDYAGRTLMNYDFLKQALAPISLSLRIEDAFCAPSAGIKTELFLVSDAPQAVTGLQWKWLARDRRGDVFANGEGTAAIQPLEVKSLGLLTLKPSKETTEGPVFVELRLEDSAGKLLVERITIFGCRDVSGPFAGLIKNKLVDKDDDVVQDDDESLRGPNNLAFVGNGAKVTASSSRSEPQHTAQCLNDGRYGKDSGWIAEVPRSWFQIALREPAVIGCFKIGRDRGSEFPDRVLDYIKIETSLDGQEWCTIFEKTGVTAQKGFDPLKTILIQVAPVKAKLVKVTVDSPKSAEGLIACVDEIEIFAPGKKKLAQLPDVQFVPIWKRMLEPKPAKRTTLVVQVSSPRIEDGQEILDLQVRNTGSMTALFCEPHPLIVYRTDLSVNNNNCFIPPKESRIISIRAPIDSKSGLSLAQTGWWLSCWNADDITVSPNADVLLSAGRQDEMCREYRGYFDTSLVEPGEKVVVGTRPDTVKIPYLLSDVNSVKFEFVCSSAQAVRPAKLRIHTSDQSSVAPTVVEIVVNGHTMEAKLPTGPGIQRTDPAHLAFPATVDFDIASGDLHSGKNSMTIRVKAGGWFSWDALDFVSKPAITRLPEVR